MHTYMGGEMCGRRRVGRNSVVVEKVSKSTLNISTFVTLQIVNLW
jgi:hypothetical protein